MQDNVISVKQLNLYARSLLEGDIRLSNIAVAGELSNFKNHYSSGHWYFTLKDNDAAIRCVMFRGNASAVKFEPSDGLQVILRGRVSIYERDGQYQFYAEEMLPAGIGDIALKFEQTKEKLKKEGLFDPENKRQLVKFPKKIAVVTSPTGAAVRDIFNILSRRWPLAEIIMCPVSVQGELAVPEMLKTLDRVYEVEGVDALIIGRGGGSAEDLWAFNDEALARKIYESPFPVISAVGHETDFTICDFVADLRAPTPSAAAELAVPDIEEVKLKLQRYAAYLKNSLNAKYKLYESKLAAFTSNQIIKNPLEMLIERNYELIDRLSDNIKDEILENYKRKENEFLKSVAVLDGLSPLKTLTRGYAWVTSEEKPVKSVNDIEADDILNLRFTDGDAECKVIKKRRV